MVTLANMLVQIKNAQAARKTEVVAPFSAMKRAVAEVLVRAGFLASVDTKQRKAKRVELPVLHIGLKEGAICGIKLVSKPSRRMYAGASDLKPVKDGFGITVVSTSKGIMTGSEAKKANRGGEVLFEIW